MFKVLLSLLVSISMFASDLTLSDVGFLVKKVDGVDVVYSMGVDKNRVIDFPDTYDKDTYLPIFQTYLKSFNYQYTLDKGVLFVSSISQSSGSLQPSSSFVPPISQSSGSLLPPPLLASTPLGGAVGTLSSSSSPLSPTPMGGVSLDFSYISYNLKFLDFDSVKPLIEFSSLPYAFSQPTKTLIFKANKFNKKSILKTIDQLTDIDKPKDQVTIKVTIFDLDQNKLKKVGINPNLSFDFGLLNPIGALLTRASIPAFKSSLAFLASDGISNVIQSTSYLLADGEKLEFKKTVSMPFLDENYALTAVTGSVNQSKKYKYKDVGFVVNATPTIVGDLVYLNFFLNVQNIISTGDLPVTSGTSITNKFTIVKGDMVLLAGIKKNTFNKSYSGLPFWMGMNSDSTDDATFNVLIEVF